MYWKTVRIFLFLGLLGGATFAFAGGDDDGRAPASCTSSESVRPAYSGSSIALFLWVNEHNIEAVREEVAAGADVNVVLGAIGRTPLHTAARLGNASMVRELLALGARRDARDCNGNTPLDLARVGGHDAVVAVFQDEVPSLLSLPAELLMCILSHLAVKDWAHASETCRRLHDIARCELMMGVHREGDGGAVYAENEWVSQMQGSDQARVRALLNMCDLRLCPIGVLQLMYEDVDLIEYFGLENAVKYSDEHGCTPLHVASACGNIDLVQWLIRYGGLVNPSAVVVHENGERQGARSSLDEGSMVCVDTPLIIAVRRGHKEVVRCFLNWGADIEVQDAGGNTPLYWAVYNGDFQMMEMLLEFGANAGVVDGLGQTLVRIARARGHDAIAERLAIAEHLDDGGAYADIAIDHGGYPMLRIPIYETDSEAGADTSSTGEGSV